MYMVRMSRGIRRGGSSSMHERASSACRMRLCSNWTILLLALTLGECMDASIGRPRGVTCLWASD